MMIMMLNDNNSLFMETLPYIKHYECFKLFLNIHNNPMKSVVIHFHIIDEKSENEKSYK